MKYNQELVNKVKNHEVMIKIDDWSIIEDLVNHIYPNDKWPPKRDIESRKFVYTMYNPKYYNFNSDAPLYWGCNVDLNNDGFKGKSGMAVVNASKFLIK
jgi:hypothetical protein